MFRDQQVIPEQNLAHIPTVQMGKLVRKVARRSESKLLSK